MFLSLALLGIGTAGAAPELRLSTTLAAAPLAPAGRASLPPALRLRLADDVRTGIGALLLDKALSMLGTEYALGRNDGDAVDCSGLVQQVFRSAGLDLPRTADELLKTGVAVPRAQLRPGDLLIYRWKPRQLHVAVYVDDGYIVHASPSAGRVVVTELSGRWRRKLVAVRRLL